MKLVGLKRFQGRDLADVLRYLRGDLPRSFLDLTTVLQIPRRVPTIEAVHNTDLVSSWSGSATPQELTKLDLQPGKWHLYGTATYSQGSTSHTFTAASLWLTKSPIAMVPQDALLGYNYSVLQIDTGDDDIVSLSCQWVIDLAQRTTISLQGQATYSGGASAPKYRCALVAHGYVME